MNELSTELESIAVDVRNLEVSFGYGSGPVLRDIHFSIPAGSFATLLGPNGSGKSTLVRTILGLIPHARGSIQLFGVDHRLFPSMQTGYVPQVKTLDRSFPARVEDLVATGLLRGWPWRKGAAHRQEIQQALEQAGVGHLAERFMSDLSGGEMQRVYLARSLIRRPRLIVLDEPASGVDFTGEEDLYSILGEYRVQTGATILMVTHDIQVARTVGDLVLLLNHRLVGAGAPEELLTSDCLDRLFVYSHSGEGVEGCA